MVAGALIMRAGLVIIGEVLRRIYEVMIQLVYVSMSNRAMLQKPSTTTASQLTTIKGRATQLQLLRWYAACV